MKNKREKPKISLSEVLTYSTVKLNAYVDNKLVSTGTGFIVHLCVKDNSSVPVIVTNKHVIVGTTMIEFEFCKTNADGSPNDLEAISCKLNAPWLNHPDDEVDLCCLPIAAILKEYEAQGEKPFYVPLETKLIPSDEVINNLTAMEDIVMIGYPTGIIDTYNHKPIIRKGVTATHIKKDYLGKKQFMIDIACYGGSSGSPVFILNEGSYSYLNNLYKGNRVYFIGILCAGAVHDVFGKITFTSTPIPRAQTKIFTNLGLVIKSSKILDFEPIFWKMIKSKEVKPQKINNGVKENIKNTKHN